MSDKVTTPYEVVFEGSRLIHSREGKLGHPADDGPTAEQVNKLCADLQPFIDDRGEYKPSELWDSFRSVTETEMAWLFPERDPVAQFMIPALQEIQSKSGNAFCRLLPDQQAQLERFANLAVAANAARRAETAGDKGPSWRMFLARCLYRIGIKRAAIAIGSYEVERWKDSGK